MIIDRPINPPRNAPKPPERGHDRAGTHAERNPFCLFGQTPGEDEVVEEVGEHVDGEGEGGSCGLKKVISGEWAGGGREKGRGHT